MANPVRVFERGADGVLIDRPTPAPQTGDVFPAGSMIDYVAGDVPTGWLVADGSVVSRATFPALFAAIGTLYGAGDGVSTFGLPDTRGRVPVGKAAAGTFATLGATGGVETIAPDVTQMPSHDHGASSGAAAPAGSTDTHGGHTHAGDRDCGVNGSTAGVTNFRCGSANWTVMQTPNFLTGGAHSHAVSVNGHTHSVSSQGSGTAHNNLQPYHVMQKLIKAH